VPPHRMTPLKDKWLEIQKPIVEHMLLQVRMNVKLRSVELRTSEATQETQALQKAADFVKAFLLGFDISDGSCQPNRSCSFSRADPTCLQPSHCCDSTTFSWRLLKLKT
jgi:hypothetical protein